MILYMEVTTDKYRLPVAVAETLAELARLRKSTASSICKSIHHCQARHIEGKYIKVEIEDDE